MTGGEAALARFIDQATGTQVPLSVAPMAGGGSCEIFAVDRGSDRWVLRRAPEHASSATAHDVLREFRILDAIQDQAVPIARPVLACDDPAVYGRPFFLMERIDGVPIRSDVPAAWAAHPETHGMALEHLVDALAAIHAVDWMRCGLATQIGRGGRAHRAPTERWLSQLGSYGGRDLPAARPRRRLARGPPPGRPAQRPVPR